MADNALSKLGWRRFSGSYSQASIGTVVLLAFLLAASLLPIVATISEPAQAQAPEFDVVLEADDPPASNVFGNPDLPDWKPITVENTADFIIVNADNLIFKFRKGGAGYNEIWQDNILIVADERWIVEYLFKAPDTWKTRGIPQYIEWEQPENYHVIVKRYYRDWGEPETTFWVVYDFYGRFRPKISVEMEVGQEDNYRIAWKALGINKTHVENKTNYVRFWNEGEEAIVFDYSDVYETFGDITEVEIEPWANDHKLNEYFKVGRLGVGSFRLDPNFGYETEGSIEKYVNGEDMYGSVFTSPSNVQTADSLTFYVSPENGPKNVKGVLVLHSNLNIVANGIGNPISITSAGWYTSSFSTPPSLSPDTEYVLMLIPESWIYLFYDAGETNQGHRDTTNSYSSPTNPTDATHNNDNYSIYCTYTAAAEPPGKPILISPENNYSTSDNTPTFAWENGSDATSHRLVIDNSQDFDDGENIYDNAGAWDNSGTAIENELPVDNYWWRVCATNAQGDNWSENTWTFEITEVPPEEYERPVEQGFSLAGVAPRGAEFGRVIEQGFSIGAVVAIAMEICKLLSQAFGFTGAVGVTFGWGKSLSQGFSLGGEVEAEAEYHPTIDYPSKGVNYLHSGVADIVDEPEFIFLWRSKILGTYDEFSGPIVVGNKVWVANKEDNIFRCLELQTGSLIWSYQLNTSTDGTPLWFDNKVYVGTGSVDSGSIASLYSFNADNGDNLWKYDGGNNNHFASTPWINTDNRIIYWVDGQYLRALDVDNGELLWSVDVGAGDHCYTGVYYDGVTYCPGLIRAYNAENGENLLWSIGGSVWDSGITVDSENIDNIVLYVCRSNPAEVWAVNPENGDNYWVKVIDSGDKYLLGVPAIWENKVYITGDVGTITVLNKENGDIIWENADGTIFSSPTILPSGKVVYVNNGGILRVRNADNGDLLWTYGIGTSYAGHIAVVDNYMLVPSDLGYLWAFGLGNVSPNSPTGLLTENQTNPTNLADNIPTFSAVFTDNDLGDWVRHLKIEVGTTEGDNDKWASGILELPMPRTENNENSYPINYGITLAEGFENLDGWEFITEGLWDSSYGTSDDYNALGWSFIYAGGTEGSPDYVSIKKEFDLTDVNTIFIDYILSANTGTRTAKIIIGSDIVWSLQTMVGTKSYTEKEIPLENSYGIENVTIALGYGGGGGARATLSVNRLQFLKPSNLEKGTTYYWRTKFVDENGKEGAWSTETATFKITTQEYERPVEQGFSLAGVAPRGAEFGRVIEQGFSIGAVVTIVMEICKLLSQAFGLTGAVGVTFGWGKSLAQDFSLDGEIDAKAEYDRLISQDFSLDGEIDAKVEYDRLISQDFSLTESIMVETAIVGRLWISDGGDLIYEVATDDPETIIDSYDFGTAAPFGCEENDGYIFFVDYGTDTLYKKLWSNKSEDNSWDISAYSGNAAGLAYGDGYFWIADPSDDQIYKVDPADPTTYVAIIISTGMTAPEGLDWNSDNNRLLVADSNGDHIYSFDVSSVGDNQDTWDLTPDWTFAAPDKYPCAVVWDGTYFWTLDDGTNLLYKHYDNGDVITSYDPPGGNPQGLAFGLYVPPPPPTEYEYPIEQGFSLTGEVDAKAEYDRLISQDFSFTDSITVKKEVLKNLSETFSLSATVMAPASVVRDLSEELSFTTSVESLYAHIYDLSADFSIDAAVGTAIQKVVSITQEFSLIGVVEASMEFSGDIAQDFSLSESVEVIIPINIFQGFSLTESVQMTGQFVMNIAQDFSLGATVDVVVPPPPPPERWERPDLVLLVVFTLVLMVLAMAFDSPVLAFFGGVSSIFTGLLLLDRLWVGLVFVGFGIYFILIAVLSEEVED